MTLHKPTIYISYAWGDDPNTEESKAIETLCKALTASGYICKRDINYIKYGDSILELRSKVGKAAYIVAIIGQKYLHSENCMIEAARMVHQEYLEERVFPIVLSDLGAIYSIDGRSKLIKGMNEYWESKESGLRTALDKYALSTGFIPMREDISFVRDILVYIASFINYAGTHYQSFLDEHIKENYAKIISKINEQVEKDNKALLKEFGHTPSSSGYYQQFSNEYIGRKDNIDHILKFLDNPDQHFLLFFGVGGMGKSHLISECRKSYNKLNLYHTQCDSTYNLKSLFKTCGVDYPDHTLSVNEKHQCILDYICKNDIYLILDDFYETIADELRTLLPKMAAIPNGKILLISRAIPKELANCGKQFEKYELPPLYEDDFKKMMMTYILSEEMGINLSEDELHGIFAKTQGYPLGGHLILNILNLGEKLDDILSDIPIFSAEYDPEGKLFSGRLLDNIFQKGSIEEIRLLCEFSALYGASSKELIKQLPSYRLDIFDTLVNRRRFILRDEYGLFVSHAMIRDYSYEKLSNKNTIHAVAGKYFENKLMHSSSFNASLMESALQHYMKLGPNILSEFKDKLKNRFTLNNIKSLVDENVLNTINNYQSLLRVYPEKIAYYNELGMAYRLDMQTEKAIATFEKAIQIDPKNLHCLNELGIVYRETKQYEKAIAIFKEAIQIDPKNLHCLNELGMTYRETKQYEKAIITFEKAIQIDPKDLPSYNELGMTYRETKQYEKAIITFEKAIQIDPKHLPSYNELGMTYRETKQYEKAIAIFEKAIQIDPKQLPSYNELGMTYRETKQYDKAIAIFEKAIQIDPKHLPSYNELGMTYRETKQYEKAIITFEKAIQIDPKDLPSYNELGMTYRETKQYEKAIITFEKAIQIDPKQLPSYNELGMTYRETKQYDKAIAIFEKAIQIDPKQLPSYNELGMTYRETKQYDKAIAIFEKAIQIDPKDLPSYNELGMTYRETKQYEKAIITFEKAIRIDPKHLPSYNELGMTYRETKQYEKAIITFEKAIQIDPKHLPSYNELGIVYRETKQYEKAIITFEKAIQIDPNNLPSYNELGMTYRETKQYEKAIITFEKAIQIDPNNLPSYNELGITYRESNQIDKAIEICIKSAKYEFLNKFASLNLLQIYLFFRPDKKKAKYYYDELSQKPSLQAFLNSRKQYFKMIEHLESILDLSIQDTKILDLYVFNAIRCKAYHSILPLLFKQNEKYPQDSKTLSRLGKTLCNEVISRGQEGAVYIQEAIQLFEQEGNEVQYKAHIMFLLYNYLNNNQIEDVKSTLNKYEKNLLGYPVYYRFLAKYYEALEKPIEDIIAVHEKSLELSLTVDDKIQAINCFVDYLTSLNSNRHLALMKDLIDKKRELVEQS